ncbi:MAG: tRNA epoxyqueuosine(34) reductase QueG [Bacteriovoracaceae bacterium]|nr:tRNA epoxyqueuosine(34) reductase QueG [Bacteriovoracaceae bacterium]
MSLLNLSEDFLKQIQIVEWGYTEASSPLTWNHFQEWTDKGLHGDLNYLSDHRKDLRRDLKEVFPEFKSALVFLFEYTSEKKRLEQKNSPLKIASYVTGFEGMDYHHWIREKLDKVSDKLSEELDELKTFYSIDAQPVLERDLAYRAGLGWFGKNSMLISKKHGSYFIIGTLLLNQKLGLPTKTTVEPDHCGTCTACIDSCPTNAIIDNKIVDASKCISTYTIEMFKEADAPKGYPTSSNEVFGCDICQEVCPWNNKPIKRVEASEEVDWIQFFERNPKLILDELELMSNRQYRKKFKGTPLERTGRLGMMKNLNKLKS